MRGYGKLITLKNPSRKMRSLNVRVDEAARTGRMKVESSFILHPFILASAARIQRFVGRRKTNSTGRARHGHR